MRKGIFLIEMMAIMAVMILFSAMMIKPMRNITRTVPQMQQDYNTNSIINDMLDDLRKDVEASSGLMEYQSNAAASGDMLIIDSPDGAVSYSFEDNKVTRLCDGQQGVESSNPLTAWNMPGGMIDWKVRDHDGKIVAVEISTGVNRRTHSGVKTNLKNSHVLFVGVNIPLEQL